MDKAISLDPEIAYAYALKSFLNYVRVIMGYTDDTGACLKDSIIWARKAITLDEREVFAYRALGGAEYMSGRYEEAIKSLDRAIEINPNYAEAYIVRSLAMLMGPTPDPEAIRQSAQTGMRLSPKDPAAWVALNALGAVCIVEGDFEKAVDYYRQSCRQPVTTYFPFYYLAMALKLLGRDDEADTAFARAREMNPDFTLAKQLQQIGKYAVSRFEVVGGEQALKDLGLPDA